jgi:hypothetical protein
MWVFILRYMCSSMRTHSSMSTHIPHCSCLQQQHAFGSMRTHLSHTTAACNMQAICVLILLAHVSNSKLFWSIVVVHHDCSCSGMCPHTTICVRILLCVRMLLYVSSRSSYYHMRPHTIICVLRQLQCGTVGVRRVCNINKTAYTSSLRPHTLVA